MTDKELDEKIADSILNHKCISDPEMLERLSAIVNKMRAQREMNKVTQPIMGHGW